MIDQYKIVHSHEAEGNQYMLVKIDLTNLLKNVKGILGVVPCKTSAQIGCRTSVHINYQILPHILN